MNRVVIVLVSVDYVNAKEVCNKSKNKDFKSSKEIQDYFLNELDSEGEEVELINIYNLDEFIACVNDDTLSLENYFVCQVTKNINLTNQEIYKQWEKNVQLDVPMVGDLGDFDCLIFELPNKDYRIGYDEENDQFYFSKYENEEVEEIISYSENPNNLEYWTRLIEVEIKTLKK